MKSLLLSAAILAAFGAIAQPATTAAPPSATQAATTAPLVAAHYANLVHANYEDTLNSAKAMQTSIDAFIASPSAEGLAKARKAWIDAREFYGQTEAFRFYAGPIDDKNGPEGRINAWPMDEAYVDGVKGKPNAGIVNNPKVKITKKGLAALNERNGEENIATGWHAIEFLLWGQDLSETGPGDRSFEDFVDGKAPNANRRREYLKVVTELLVDDLGTLVKAWAPGAKNYRARFEKSGTDAVRRMLVGVGSLSRGELAGERIEVALASQNQEDEHSCFSDNTHRDIVNNARGIENVWLGTYKRADGTVLAGPSLRDLVAAKDAATAERATAHVAASVKAAEAIQPPFDREIVGGPDAPGRKRVQAVADALKLQSNDFVAAAKAVGITKLTLVDPAKE
ncbi:iron-regulated protein [Rhodoferax koreense]|uniref:Iron-regulated protein n=1 Tax=Rhodoferax koreensis TaxID=1842727 RepID=A0A1P8JZG6_9BURK|nr:imelysin family protein [Rhodoferax koreense]APW39144.1 iron-regulated protein [Rhodoferax koreense]